MSFGNKQHAHIRGKY